MVTNWKSELAATELAHFDDSRRHRLPRRKASNRDRAIQVGHDSAPWRALRVLVVGDEQDTTDKLVRLARRSGHAARAAYDGLTALRIAARRRPDVVLLNLELQLISGRQVARQLRLDYPREECFVIAAARRADDDRCQQCSEVGIDLVLVAPVDPSVVETLLMLECVRVNRRRALRTDNNGRKRHETGGSSC